MQSDEMKRLLGVLVQSDGLASDGILLKLFYDLDFDNLRDLDDLLEAVNWSGLLKKPIDKVFFDSAYSLLDKHDSQGIEIIPIGEAGYPVCLETTDRPPALLYIKGNRKILDSLPGVAVVGSREISTAASEITRRITTQLCGADFVIVSGLAIGVDATAHRAALHAKGKTIAVLAHGLEEAKPKQNARLGSEILEHGGAWVSEYPIGRRVLKQSFVQRNRIQVGLSAGSVIVEATLDSGTMTQAEFCLKANRPLFAVVPHLDHNPLKLNCEGTTRLVADGNAIPLKTKSDYEGLISKLEISKNQLMSRVSGFGLRTSMLI